MEPAGDLAVSVGGAPVQLHGYVLTGLIWGAETLWLDDHDELAALISTDSEFDHFEAVRERFEPAFPTFVQAAAQNSLNRRDEALAIRLAAGVPHFNVERRRLGRLFARVRRHPVSGGR